MIRLNLVLFFHNLITFTFQHILGRSIFLPLSHSDLRKHLACHQVTHQGGRNWQPFGEGKNGYKNLVVGQFDTRQSGTVTIWHQYSKNNNLANRTIWHQLSFFYSLCQIVRFLTHGVKSSGAKLSYNQKNSSSEYLLFMRQMRHFAIYCKFVNLKNNRER